MPSPMMPSPGTHTHKNEDDRSQRIAAKAKPGQGNPEAKRKTGKKKQKRWQSTNLTGLTIYCCCCWLLCYHPQSHISYFTSPEQQQQQPAKCLLLKKKKRRDSRRNCHYRGIEQSRGGQMCFGHGYRIAPSMSTRTERNDLPNQDKSARSAAYTTSFHQQHPVISGPCYFF